MKSKALCVALFLSAITAPASAQQVTPAPPGPDVPAVCAKFFGSWVGDWSYIGRQWLRVVKVGASCTVQYSYLGSDAEPKSSQYYLSSIENGMLSMKCGSSTCTFKANGDELYAAYSDPQGRANNAVFARYKP